MLQASAGVITMTFEDDGVAFDPCSGAAARANEAGPATLEEAADGGFGLMMVRRAASKMRYTRTTDARNRLTVELHASSTLP
jgi:anti-sigma regulatory factor (Ser/Thr protein kinase)